MRGRAETERFNEDLVRAIEPFNVAGLGQRNRRNWYPVDAEDLLSAASKVGADREELAASQRRAELRRHA